MQMNWEGENLGYDTKSWGLGVKASTDSTIDPNMSKNDIK